MNFYTDDSPGIKLQPVGARGPLRSASAAGGPRRGQRGRARLRSRGARRAAPAAAAAAGARAPAAPHAHTPPPRPQVWVIVMSLGFILFVTVLHIIGKLRG
jgi:hypothetical protein